jgi:5-methylcytosine-specific restriction endonuclease McrA
MVWCVDLIISNEEGVMVFTEAQKIESQRRRSLARRNDARAAYFADKVCVECGSVEQLELDHIDPETKVTHNIWGWAPSRWPAELAKCQVLCHDCHLAKSIANGDMSNPGENNPNSKLTDIQVLEIRASNKTQVVLAKEYGVAQPTISSIIRRKLWSHI